MTSSGTSLDQAIRDELLRALFHHLNGGLHNATLALELVAHGPVERAASAESRALGQAGLRGLGQASRSLQLVSALLNFARTADAESSLELVDDVIKMLRICAMRHRIDFQSELRPEQLASLDFDRVVDILTSGCAKIAGAPEGARVRMKPGDEQRSLPVAFDVDSAS